MPSNICLVETHAQPLGWGGSTYNLEGEESRDTSVRLAVARGLPIKTISNEQKNEKETEK